MNEQDLEKRLRDVVDGPQPQAPSSLHRFLRDLPETQAKRHSGFIGYLRGGFERIPALLAPQPSARLVRAVVGVSAAIVIGIAGGGLLLQLRGGPQLPATTGPTGNPSPAPWVMPRRSLGTHQPPVQASLGLGTLVCAGVPSIDNSSVALPLAAVVTNSGRFLGVTGGSLGTPGIVQSDDGLHWDWSPPTAVNPHASIVTSIASDSATIVVTGGTQGAGGVVDGRIWVSLDDGNSWRETAADASFGRRTVEKVVSGPNGEFVALGWSPAADASAQVAEWLSSDGVTWTSVATPIGGSAGSVFATPGGFVLSGTPLASGFNGQPLLWWSTDGRIWTQAAAADQKAQLVGPLLSATVTGSGVVIALGGSADGMANQLVASSDSGHTWRSISPNPDTMPYSGSISHVASLSANDGVHEYLFATQDMGEGAHVWVSQDGGETWAKANDSTVGGPTGTILVQVGNGYVAGKPKILAFGDPGSGLGIWLLQMGGS